MSLQARRELAAAIASRYHKASKSAKSQILDEFVEATGYHRKYAIVVLDTALWVRTASQPPRSRCRKYGREIEQPFLLLWRVSGGICPKRLMPFLKELIDVLERFGEIHLCPAAKDKLLQMSVATAERLLQRARRAQERGISTTMPGTLLRQQIPIRTYEEWTENRPGFLEIDLVAHCGGTAAGDYCYTLTLTDICTGWTECIAIANRGQIAVRDAIESVRKRLPFRMLGIDSDNGSEFINHVLKAYTDEHQITFTRCRPYKKNDQCHVEQKNGAVVRPLVGYARYEGPVAVAYLNRLYAVHRLCLNYFEPSMKLVEKIRVGSKVKKTYDQPKTPFERLLPTLPEQKQTDRRTFYQTLNPAQLRRDLEELEMGLRHFAVQTPPPPAPAKEITRNVTIAPAKEITRNVTINITMEGSAHGQDA